MSNLIVVEDLHKCYRLGLKDKRAETLSQAAWQWIASPFKSYKRLHGLTHFKVGEQGDDILWALQGVSFEVKKGEVLGIIGKNGAGKSTLLKILSKITRPTKGKVTLRGRVASLLEVGTGFHPDLTGRENVYLNGTILGMTAQEVDRKFDEIVAFAEVDRFIDTPIKRYSSGMAVRLAFAVAAFLEPEMLIVDEVLAVGDVAFQKKCLGRMGYVARNHQRTVLFVSHNMGAVRTLCSRAILLEKGKVAVMGTPDEVIAHYLSKHKDGDTIVELPPPQEDKGIKRLSLAFQKPSGELQNHFCIREPFEVVLEFELTRPLPHVIGAIGVTNTEGLPIITYWSKESDLKAGKYRVVFPIGLDLCSCELTFRVGITSHERNLYYVEDQGNVSILEVAVGDQPLRSSGTGILVSTHRPSIKAL